MSSNTARTRHSFHVQREYNLERERNAKAAKRKSRFFCSNNATRKLNIWHGMPELELGCEPSHTTPQVAETDYERALAKHGDTFICGGWDSFRGWTDRTKARLTPLGSAIYNKDKESAEALLDGGADPNEVDGNGRNALYIAAWSGCCLPLFNRILGMIRNVNLVTIDTDHTALMRAAMENHLVMVISLMNHRGIDVNFQSCWYGLTALHYAVLDNNPIMVAHLVSDDRVDTSLKDNMFGTPLKLAILHGYKKYAKMILREHRTTMFTESNEDAWRSIANEKQKHKHKFPDGIFWTHKMVLDQCFAPYRVRGENGKGTFECRCNKFRTEEWTKWKNGMCLTNLNEPTQMWRIWGITISGMYGEGKICHINRYHVGIWDEMWLNHYDLQWMYDTGWRKSETEYVFLDKGEKKFRNKLAIDLEYWKLRKRMLDEVRTKKTTLTRYELRKPRLLRGIIGMLIIGLISWCKA
jgi:hypothetical protein